MKHKWFVCEMCGPSVLCGNCGNNTCNGGSGDINGEPCEYCLDAHKFCAEGYKKRLLHPSTYLWQFKQLIMKIRIKLGFW